jgi:hypothetical protein
VAERERADQQPRHDLVAHAEQQCAVEHLVRQRDSRRHRDDFPAEQRQFHAGTALGDAVAHRGHTAGELRDTARLAYGFLEPVRVFVQRLMR